MLDPTRCTRPVLVHAQGSIRGQGRKHEGTVGENRQPKLRVGIGVIGDVVLGQSAVVVNPHSEVGSRPVGGDQTDGQRIVLEHDAWVLQRHRFTWIPERGQPPARSANGHFELPGVVVPVNQMRCVLAVDVDFNARGEVHTGSNHVRLPAVGSLGGGEDLLADSGRVSKHLLVVVGRC